MDNLGAMGQELLAGWQSGYAEDCKSLYVGSIPVPASRNNILSLVFLKKVC
jgi:hypothetical protein